MRRPNGGFPVGVAAEGRCGHKGGFKKTRPGAENAEPVLQIPRKQSKKRNFIWF